MKNPVPGSVLHIEDDEDIRHAVYFGLRELHGIHVRVCSSGNEGLMAAANYPADLLLLDVMMPEIDGPTVLAGLRQNQIHRDTPAIFLTSLVDPEDLRYYESLGVIGVIPKPFDPVTLGERIADLLASHDSKPAFSAPLASELEILHRVFSRDLPVRLSRIRDALTHIRHDPVTRADCAQLWEMIEDLRCSANAYGNHKISEAARRAEQRVAGLVLSADRNSRDLLDIEMDLMSWAM